MPLLASHASSSRVKNVKHPPLAASDGSKEGDPKSNGIVPRTVKSQEAMCPRAFAAPPYFVDVVGLDLSHSLLRAVQDRLDVAQLLRKLVRERGTKCVIYWFLQGSITFL